jgi:serine/threonine protein kinase
MSNEKFKCIRRIGKGSFSNVYLFENENFSKNIANSIGYDSLLFSNIIYEKNKEKSTLLDNQYFIIKEIDLSKLVSKYLCKKKIEKVYHRKDSKNRKSDVIIERGILIPIKKGIVNGREMVVWDSTNVNITPYSHTRPSLAKFDEEDYYYSKLRELIESEIIILKNLEHINIIRYYNSSILNDVYSIKMEFCNLGDLYSILKEVNDFSETTKAEIRIVSESDKYNLKKYRNSMKGFNNKFIKKFLIDTINGLKYIHDKNIIHRDIKLHNFLVNKSISTFNENNDKGNFELDFKISDFGFSCYDLSEVEDENLMSSFMNINSSYIKKKYYKLCGTPYYMAPEILTNLDQFDQLLSNNSNSNSNSDLHASKSDIDTTEIKKKLYNKKIDLWSYGICLYELLFNVLPFSNMADINDLRKFYLNKTTQVKIFKNIDEKFISLNLKNILRKLLTINPIERISTDELNILFQDLTDEDLECGCKGKANYKDTKLNMDSWLIEDFKLNTNMGSSSQWDKIDTNEEDKFKDLTVSVDNNFIKWLGI